MTQQPSPIAIIGAGYAGMSAAVTLAERGIPVVVFESARTVGGRARIVQRNGLSLDNGQHILIGAYLTLIRLMKLVGVDVETAFRRLPLRWIIPEKIALRAPRWPAPFHLVAALLCARGPNWRERIDAAHFLQQIQSLKFRLNQDETVTSLLNRFRQTGTLRQWLWEPMCLAALNTPPNKASAQIFLNTLRDTLAAPRHASDLLLPATDLSAIFPEPAKKFVSHHGGEVLTNAPIRGIQRAANGYVLNGDPHSRCFEQVIIATAPHHVPSLLANFSETLPIIRRLNAFQYEPITTCYSAYPSSVQLPEPMLGSHTANCQWWFDRGQLGGPAGLIAGVISARHTADEMDRETLAQCFHEELKTILPTIPAPLWQFVIREKRATFSCQSELERPGIETGINGLLLCGDYVASDYPATLESAVRSGVNAAHSAMS